MSTISRFAFVTETYPPEINGVALTIYEKVQRVQSMGVDVQLIRARQPADKTNSLPQDIETLLIPSLPIPGYNWLNFGLPYSKRMLRLWQTRRPDAIYVGTEGPMGWAAVSAAKKLGIPVVSGFHTNFHQYSNHYHLGWFEGLIVRYLRFFHNRTARTVVSTSALKAQLTELGINNAEVIGRGIDCQRFHPSKRSSQLRASWQVADDHLAVIYVGRLAAEKNIALAIEAFLAIQSQHPSAQFILVGDGPIAPQLRKQHPDFIFAGMQTGDDLTAHFASADLMLFPSETETFGNVVLEAMASGVPVLAYDYAAAGENITHNHSGFKTALGDAAAYLQMVTAAVQDLTSLEQIKINARQAAEHTSWETIASRLVQVAQDAKANLPLPGSQPAAD